MSHHDEIDEGGPVDTSAGHETRDINIRSVVLFGLYLAVAAAVIHLLIWFLYGYMNRRAIAGEVPEFPMAAASAPQLPPDPRLQTQPREDLKHLREEEAVALAAYRWVDRETGVVQIPIDRAMQLVAERGLPVREPATTFKAPPMPSKANAGRPQQTQEARLP